MVGVATLKARRARRCRLRGRTGRRAPPSALRRGQDLLDTIVPLLMLALLLEAKLIDTAAQLLLVFLQQRVELLELKQRGCGCGCLGSAASRCGAAGDGGSSSAGSRLRRVCWQQLRHGLCLATGVGGWLGRGGNRGVSQVTSTRVAAGPEIVHQRLPIRGRGNCVGSLRLGRFGKQRHAACLLGGVTPLPRVNDGILHAENDLVVGARCCTAATPTALGNPVARTYRCSCLVGGGRCPRVWWAAAR